MPTYTCARCTRESTGSPFRMTCRDCGARLISRVGRSIGESK